MPTNVLLWDFYTMRTLQKDVLICCPLVSAFEKRQLDVWYWFHGYTGLFDEDHARISLFYKVNLY